MAGIRDLLGLIYWMDNAKSSTLEALLENKKTLPRERLLILKALEKEKQSDKPNNLPSINNVKL